MTFEKDVWLSAYLYYSGSFEAFLVQAVKPFIEKIIADQLVHQFFFIRYWDNGPHIRLRFKGNTELLSDKVKPEIIAYFESYFSLYPSARIEPLWIKDLPADQQWYPDNSVYFVEYIPEIQRYGGSAGILIAEQQFEASSRAILTILNNDKHGWDYNRALGVAIQMHLSFAHALGMNFSEAIDFFTYSSTKWSTRAYSVFANTGLDETAVDRQDEAFVAFGNSFNKQKDTLLPLFSSLWNACETEQEVEQKWFNIWVNDMRQIRNLLEHSAKANCLTSDKRTLWSILDSYVHMTNNRLGIQNRDEGYLGYVLKEGLKLL